VNPDANPADVLEQSREVGETDEVTEPEPAPVVGEADPVDVHEQNVPVPAEDEDWPDG
jgi:hypothetical protein